MRKQESKLSVIKDKKLIYFELKALWANKKYMTAYMCGTLDQ